MTIWLSWAEGGFSKLGKMRISGWIGPGQGRETHHEIPAKILTVPGVHASSRRTRRPKTQRFGIRGPGMGPGIPKRHVSGLRCRITAKNPAGVRQEPSLYG